MFQMYFLVLSTLQWLNTRKKSDVSEGQTDRGEVDSEGEDD